MIRFFKIPVYQLYLLQLENYEFSRFLGLLFKKGLFPPKKGQRKSLVRTTKTRLLLVLSLVIYLLVIFIIYSAFSFSANLAISVIAALIALLALLPFYFIFLYLSSLLILPVEIMVKRRIVNKARGKIRQLPNLAIIGVAGSYGKTSMKEALKASLGSASDVVATPESVNTPLGIARFILREIDEKTRVFIVEMGEHYKGDITELCQLAQPDIAIITGINQSHLERLGKLETTIETIFEITEGSKDDGLIILNADDKRVVDNYKRFTNGKRVVFYSANNSPLTNYAIGNHKFIPESLVNQFDILENGKKIANMETKILGGYIAGITMAAVIVGKELEIAPEEIVKGIGTMKPVPHRLEPIVNPNGLLVIDDSYNGNPDGVREAISLLGKFENRRKVFITPGLVETGTEAQTIHIDIGRRLAKAADLVILIKNSVSAFIEQGLMEGGFPKEQIVIFDTAEESHAALNRLLKKGDVIVFQNDWGDQYL